MIGLDSDPGKKYSGVITGIANIGEQRPNSDSKVFEVRILMNEKDTTLRPSMTTSNLIVVSTAPINCRSSGMSLPYRRRTNVRLYS